jgi:hypothetical protein
MHDPEAVEALLCSDEGAADNQYVVEGVYSADVGPHVAAATVSWCARCNAQFELTANRRQQILCDACIDWDSIDSSPEVDIEIVPPAPGSTSLMLELSDSTSETDTTSEEDLGQSMDPIDAPTAHDIHAAILGHWSGLELHPSAFTTACDSTAQFFTDGYFDADGKLKWDGCAICPNGSTVSRLFKIICKSPRSEGLTADQLELAYGLGSALEELTTRHNVNGSALTPSPTIGSSAEGSPVDQNCTEADSPGTFFTRVGDRYSQLRSLESESIACTRTKRAASQPTRFEPSPTGIKRDAVSDDEFFAAVWDSDLSDASIDSDHGVTGCAEYLALLVADKHGSVLSSRVFDQLNFHVPSIKIESEGVELHALRQLLGGLYSESQQLLSTLDPSIILIASELIEVEHDDKVITVRICLKSLCEYDATVKTTILSSLYCALHGVPGDIEWFPTGVIAAWNGCLSTHLNGGCRQRQDFH